MVRRISLIIALLLPGIVAAQLDDLLESAWAAPALDVLERRREEPLCLRCCDAYELTEIPGISQRTAGRIVRAVDAGGITSISVLCDSLCLSPDQFILLTSCTTLQCSCGGSIRSASARVRVPTATEGMGLLRINIDHAFGRAGAVYAQRLDATPSVIGAWATVDLENIHIAAGDVAMSLGTGLIMGTSSGLSRSPADVIGNADNALTMRPWTSSSQEGSIRGLVIRAPIPSTGIEVLASIGRSTLNDLSEMIYACAITRDFSVASLTLSAVSTQQHSFHSLTATKNIGNGILRSELAVDQSLKWSGHLQGQYHLARTELGFSLWRYDVDMRSPFGLSSGTSSAPSNHSGILVYYRSAFSNHMSLLASLSYGGRISRSYLVPLPTSVLDGTADFFLRPWKGVNISTRLRYERSLDAVSLDGDRRMDVSNYVMARIDTDLPIAPNVQGRIRCDLRSISWRSTSLVDNGALLFLDVRWQARADLTLRGRWTQFSSTSGTIAPRMLDATVLGALTTVVANGKGARWSIAIRWQIAPWIAASCAFHEDRRVVDRDTRTDRSALFQVDLRLRASGRRDFIAVDDESGSRLE